MSLVEQGGNAKPIALHAPLCRCCHKPMRLEVVVPHARYSNLDQCEFKCECGTVLDALMARETR
jgi:hypothetical protein